MWPWIYRITGSVLAALAAALLTYLGDLEREAINRTADFIERMLPAVTAGTAVLLLLAALLILLGPASRSRHGRDQAVNRQ